MASAEVFPRPDATPPHLAQPNSRSPRPSGSPSGANPSSEVSSPLGHECQGTAVTGKGTSRDHYASLTKPTQQQTKPTPPASSFQRRAAQGGPFYLRPVVNFLFGLLISALVVLAAAGVGHVSLPKGHFCREYSDFVVSHAPRLVLSDTFKVTPILFQLAEAFRSSGLEALAAYTIKVAKWQHTDDAFLGAFAGLALLSALALGWGLWVYKRERDIEVSPPKEMFCTNLMTPEEFADKRYTFEALAQLMKDPEWLKLKAQRSVQGSEAWNWQKRARDEQHANADDDDDDGSEDLDSEEEQDESN